MECCLERRLHRMTRRSMHREACMSTKVRWCRPSVQTRSVDRRIDTFVSFLKRTCTAVFHLHPHGMIVVELPSPHSSCIWLPASPRPFPNIDPARSQLPRVFPAGEAPLATTGRRATSVRPDTVLPRPCLFTADDDHLKGKASTYHW